MISFKDQIASPFILEDSGSKDLTAHLCLETVISAAINNGWICLGSVKQGQALLALGLSEQLSALGKLPKSEIELALRKRENLLRLVDPLTLGSFYWIAFQRNNNSLNNNSIDKFTTRFLEFPSNKLG